MAATATPDFSEVDEFISQLLDYEFWAKTVYRIRDKRNELVPLLLNDVQRKIGQIEKEELEKTGNARIYVLKARQPGVSTDQQARSLHKIWSTPGAVALTLAHSRDDTDKLFQITRRAVQNFPEGLLPEMGRSEVKEITFPGLDSAFWTGTAGASRVGRGITVTRFHGSEFAFWADPRAVLGQITPAMIPIGSTIVLETTPDMFDSEAHKFWKESCAGETGYRTVFFPWWECDKVYYRLPLMSEDELGTLSEEETLLCQENNLDLEQIKWRRQKMREMGRTSFLREYPEDPETCWITSGDKFYDADLISTLLKRTPKQVRVGGEAGFEKSIRIYDERTLKTPLGTVYESVIMGADTSEGQGLDRTTWTARAFPSGRLLSEFEHKKIEPDQFADLLAKWGIEIYGEALLVVEKNFHGITVLRRLRDKLRYPKRSLYHRTPLAQTHDQKTDYIGWTTTGESLPLMLDVGRELIRAASDGFYGIPSRVCLLDALAVTEHKLNSRDILVSDILCWIGREYQAKQRVTVLRPLHYSS